MASVKVKVSVKKLFGLNIFLVNRFLITMGLDIIERLWMQAYQSWPYGDGLFFVIAMFIAHEVIWIPYNLFLLLIQWYPSELFDKWKIQKGKYPSKRLLKESFIQMAVSHLITFPILVYVVMWNLAKWIEMPISEPFPSFVKVIFDLAIMGIINDTLFYWSHRILHLPVFYKRFHAQHHRYITPIGISSEFASPLETLFANVIPTFAGAFILQSHLFTLCLWFCIRIIETIEAHSGYDFPFWVSNKLPFMHGPRGHDWHHSHNRGMYGSTIFWDWICGTDVEYKGKAKAQ